MCLPFLAAVPAALGAGGAAAGAATAGVSALGAISTAASLIGTGVSVIGQLQAGKAAQAAAEYDAQWKGALARDAIERGEIEADEKRSETRRLIGAQKATLAAGNLDIQSGSPLDIIGDTAAVGELDALTISTNARREAEGLKVGAQLSRMEGQSAKTGAMFGAIGSALGGITTVADKWYRGRTGRIGTA